MGLVELLRGPFGVAFLTMSTVLLLVAIMAWCRKCCCKPAVNYTAVNHGLDEEEMAFKRSMETQHGDEIDELFNFSGQEELEFDTNDLENIEMIQAYRSNPKGPPKPTSSIEVGRGKEDRNGDHGMAVDGTVSSTALDDDSGREAEDLEALLDGGYLEDGRGSLGENGAESDNGRRELEDREGNSRTVGTGSEKSEVGSNGRA